MELPQAVSPAVLSLIAGSEDLAWLAQLVAEQKLQTSIEVEASWHEVGEVAQHLLQALAAAQEKTMLS